MKTIQVTIQPDGSLEMDGQNFQGKECEVIDQITKDLGAQVTGDEKKPEYVRGTGGTHRRNLNQGQG